MTIRIYPDTTTGGTPEVYAYAGRIREFLLREGFDHAAWERKTAADAAAKAMRYEPFTAAPFDLAVNGAVVEPRYWAALSVSDSDEVVLHVTPAGGVFKAIGDLLGSVFSFLGFGNKSAGTSTTPKGQSLDSSNASANTAKLNEVVPEIAGRHIRYPDYLTQPRRYWASPREQWLEFLVCVGPGRYSIEDVKVGTTLFNALGEKAQYWIHQPGDDIGWSTPHQNWYNVPEVGGTSSGSAGLDLNSEFSSNVQPTASTYNFDNRGVVVPGGAGEFPSGWGVGTFLDITLRQSYSITTGGGGGGENPPPIYNIFTGNFREIAPEVGLLVNASGGINGTYRIGSFSLDGNGYGQVVLQEFVDGDWVDIDSLPAGGRTIAFKRPGRRYRLSSYSTNAIGLDAVSGGSIEGGWTGFPNISVGSGSVDIVVDQSTVYGEWSGPIRACPPGKTTEFCELDFMFPQGLAYIQNNGSLSSQTVSIEVQWRDADAGGAWASRSLSYTNNNLDVIGFTEGFTVARMAPEFRCRRVGTQATDTQIKDTAQWYGLRSRLDTRTVYPNWTTMSIRISGGGALSAQSENQINLIATRVLPWLQADGSWAAPAATRQISAWVRYMVESVGGSLDMLNLDRLLELQAIWNDRFDDFDHVFDATTVKAALNMAFGAGMAELTLDGGQITPVRDDPRSQFENEQGYSPQNTVSAIKREFTTARSDDNDGVTVEFMNEQTWVRETVNCFLPGDQGVKPLAIKVYGVVNKNRAYRIGMRQRQRMALRRWAYSFTCELSALNSSYLSYVPLIDHEPGYSESAIITNVAVVSGDDLRLTVSEPLTWLPGQPQVMAFRKPNGGVRGPFAAVRGDSDYEVLATIPGEKPVGTLKREPPHIYFGLSGTWCRPALITAIRPGGGLGDTVSVSAVNYAPGVYFYDNADAP